MNNSDMSPKSVNRRDINPIKMSTNPPEEIVNSGMRVINTDGFIYEYVGIGFDEIEF